MRNSKKNMRKCFEKLKRIFSFTYIIDPNLLLFLNDLYSSKSLVIPFPHPLIVPLKRLSMKTAIRIYNPSFFNLLHRGSSFLYAKEKSLLHLHLFLSKTLNIQTNILGQSAFTYRLAYIREIDSVCLISGGGI